KPCGWGCSAATMSQRHTLGSCVKFHDAYVARHDAVVKVLFSHVWTYSHDTYDIAIRNTAENNRRPECAVPARFLKPGCSLTHTHPDCIFIDEVGARIVLLEVTVCSDAPDAVQRAFVDKQLQYADLRDAVLPGYSCILVAIPIGHTG